MRVISIHSNSIPWLNQDIKKTINKGEWLLFTSEIDDNASYFLDIGKIILELGQNGIVREYAKSEFMPKISQIVYFHDVSKPESIENSRMLAFN